ncbi:transport and Golgi organization protein 1 homolog isoform X1 [Perognathus longimembris pacificus]|uniref:transport and Golgi organization protein 1 homolog isoform X1 n=1 Tax=Perognathus longimembris pacificus TaxID=214514 RepID=UPI00201987B7|nr:transport and Golgi organization protein 1 homolog isoform X1 [Perognathus longimembris pacificus]
MAAAAPGLLFWLLVFGPPYWAAGQPDPSPGRRFSEYKLCADDECSMLMFRGEALEDFTGPDCRFVNFKKGDPVFVYYKLAGGSPEVWAGSVGRIFGYFPKDLIKVLHEYTKEELQVPADETDFVCFDGGRDDFDNYNVEELLGFLELYDSATDDSEKAVVKASQPEISKESESEPEPVEANAEESESAFPEITKGLDEQFLAQKRHPHENSQKDNALGQQSSFDSFEEMLKDKLKVPENENKTSNSSQVTNEQEKMDAYKLLKTEMTLDLKTKFGSTADALVSDDETTRLVTSLEDDFDEEFDAEYYALENEEEENADNFEELPLLTFTEGEDEKTPLKSGMEKPLTDKEQNLNKEGKVEVTPPPGMSNDDKKVLTTLGDKFFSTVTGSEQKSGVIGSENSNSEEEEEDGDAQLPESKQDKLQSAAGDIGPEHTEDGVFVEASKTNDKDYSELPIKGHGEDVQKPKMDLVPDEPKLEDVKPEGVTLHGSSQNNKLNSLQAGEKDKDIWKTVFKNKENDLKETVIHISKETFHEEKPGEILENGPDSVSVHQVMENQVTEGNSNQKSMDIVPLLGDNQHNTSKNSMEEVDVSANGQNVRTHSVEHQRKEEEDAPETQSQPRFSSPEEIDLSRELKEKVPTLGRNLSWQQEKDMTVTVSKQVNEKLGLSEKEGSEDPTHAQLVDQKAMPGTQEVEHPEQTDQAEIPAFHTEKPDTDEDDFLPEELLEDENALSAQQSKETPPDIQEGKFDAALQDNEKVSLGTRDPDPETSGNKPSSMVLETKKSDSALPGVDELGREPGSVVVGRTVSSLADEKAQRSSKEGDFLDKKNTQLPGLEEIFLNKDPDNLEKDNPKENLNTPGLVEITNGEEISKEGPENIEKLRDLENLGPGSVDLDHGLFLGSSHTALQPELDILRETLPIISSFFREDQSLQRFLKYFDVHELEAMLHEMSLKLKSAQQESLPYNVEKVLDKVFRASESHILNVAEKMLDTRVAENKDLGMKENNMFEEAAVLDDIQDLIYFVRYKHSMVEETAPLITPPPLEEGWVGPMEEIQPPHEDNFAPENTDLHVQISEEHSLLDQPANGDRDTSQVSQKLDIEEDVDPGLLTTEVTPVDSLDTKKQQETLVEEPAGVSPLENAIGSLYSAILYLTKTIVATLPDDVQPGPDFYGLPWKPVLLTALLGIVSFAIFFWRTVLVVKNRVYQVTEQQISEKLKTIMKENTELLQKLSNYEQKIKESKKHVQETKKQNMILSDEAIKYKDKIKTLEQTNEILDDRAKNLRVMLETEREQNIKNQDLISEKKKSIEKLKDVISVSASEFSEVQIALSEAKLSEEKVKSECHRVQEENARLKKKKQQLQQEIEDWSKSHAELSEQLKSFEKSQKDLEVALTHKDDNINALTNCITQLNRLECESESEDQNKGGNESDELANGEVGGDRSEKIKNQIKQMMDVSRTQTAISVAEEDLKLLQLKLRASMSTIYSLEEQIKKLEDDRSTLQFTKVGLEDECKTLRQKVEILNELYQQKEMALQKKLSQEEYDRQEREQRLSAADEKVVLAAEEVKTYKRRIEEMEEELQKTERSFKNQIATHEKKAHDNWLKARAAERAMAEEKREAANLRHKLLEMSQKMALRQEEPVIVKPMPGRPNTQNLPRRGPLSQNGSFGPSPVSGGECSPPLTAEPPGRPLSATLSRRDMPRSEFGTVDGPLPRPRWSSEASGKPSASDPGSGPAPMMNSSSRSSSPAKAIDEGKVNMATKGPPPFPGVPLMGSPVGGPLPPPIRYGPPPQLCGPFGPRPLPPPFVPGMRPPLGLREYTPGVVPPGKRDLPLDPREFLPGHAPFRPLGSLGPREYFIPGARLPPPNYGPQDYQPPPAARDSLPSGSRDETPSASQGSGQDCSQALKQSP